ncbi:MAG TPA: sigma 54-interacting transcriptional regulator [Sandaracinaceae bacterium LLY-WYZ-13_1]|nr:sigma 54-interacting transcriptional regulator [Sandaracinaceae bacterium LLY-WYZ-13_1]
MPGEFGDTTATWIHEREHTEPVGVLGVVEGPDRGLEVELDGTTTVGKSEAADVRLTDRAVSRLHLELAREGDGIRVRDLGSKNGTWIGTIAVHDIRVASGTRLRIGASELAFAVRPGRVRRAEWTGGDRLGELVGTSAPMRALFARLAKVAATDVRVLLRGESGTGKELAARSLHRLGPRRDGPFVVVDAAAIADTLAEDELFGHVPGAFTGADRARAGAFERASGGTLFLDEIGDLPLPLQVKLLRALEDGTVQRLGATERAAVDVRVIAATHKDLAGMVNDKTFREDLYYRLAVVELTMPPLRERLEDVPRLARSLLEHDGRADAASVAAVEAALAEHRGYGWPGNVRELRNFVRRVAVLGPAYARADWARDEGAHVRADLPFHDAKERWLEHFERAYLERALQEAGGNVAEAARRSGLSRAHLSNLAKRYGLR